MLLPFGTYRFVVEPLPKPTKDQVFKTPGAIDLDVLRLDTDFTTEYLSKSETELACQESLPEQQPPDDILELSISGTRSDLAFRVAGVDLGLIIDDTGSMEAELGGVRDGLTSFIARLAEMGEPFPLTAVITFKNQVTLRTVSDDPLEIQQIIDSLFAEGGGGCTEASNLALIEAGEMLRRGSPVILATDADSRGFGPPDSQVDDLFRSKNLQLGSLVSGTCSDDVEVAGMKDEADGSTATEFTRLGDFAGPHGEAVAMVAKSGGAEVRLRSREAGPGIAPALQASSLLLDPPLRQGVKNAVESFSAVSFDTGGAFIALPEVKTFDPVERQRYANVLSNIATSAVVPAIATVDPLRLRQDSTADVEIFGGRTNFQSTSIVSFEGLDIIVNSQQAVSPSRIIANITVLPGAILGFTDVAVTTSISESVVETALGVGAVEVLQAAVVPTIVSVLPARGEVGQTLDVTIRGSVTNFVDGLSMADFGSDVTVNFTTVAGPTEALANITIAEDAVVAYRSVSVLTGAEVADEGFTGPFLVVGPRLQVPRLISLVPADAAAGSSFQVAIEGENTSFEQDETTVFFSGAGVSVANVVVNSPTSLTADVTVVEGAAPGFRDLFVETGLVERASLLAVLNITSGDRVVQIDFKPASDQNPINLGSSGVVPVAVLTTSVDDGDATDFDASSVIDSSLVLEGAAAREKGRSGNVGALEDVDGDGDLDLVVQFNIEDLELTAEDTMVVLEGSTFDGLDIRGVDMVTVVP